MNESHFSRCCNQSNSDPRLRMDRDYICICLAGRRSFPPSRRKHAHFHHAVASRLIFKHSPVICPLNMFSEQDSNNNRGGFSSTLDLCVSRKKKFQCQQRQQLLCLLINGRQPSQEVIILVSTRQSVKRD